MSPATGAFGGAAVLVALAMGAKVIAMGRSMETLEKTEKRSERIETVSITGHVLGDSEALKKSGAVNAFLISVRLRLERRHILRVGFLALKHKSSSLVGPLQAGTKPLTGNMLWTTHSLVSSSSF